MATAGPIRVTQIDSLTEFIRLRDAWASVYDADPHATIFLSWSWLRGWLEATPSRWIILAAQDVCSAKYIAFLPLSQPMNKKQGGPNELQMCGSPIADYTGFVALPASEAQAIAAFATHVQDAMNWDRFHMTDVLDPRIERFLSHFPPSRFAIQHVGAMVCPYIALPATWEQYRGGCLSPATRKSLRHSLRRIEESPCFRLTDAGPDTLDESLEALFRLWESKWGPHPPRQLDRSFGVIFRHCHAADRLKLTLLKDSDRPIAAQATLLDRKKKTAYAYLGSFDRRYAQYSPGKILDYCTIRAAIRDRLSVYDFLRGGEPYKYSFGSRDRHCIAVCITRKTLRVYMSDIWGLAGRRLRWFRFLPTRSGWNTGFALGGHLAAALDMAQGEYGLSGPGGDTSFEQGNQP